MNYQLFLNSIENTVHKKRELMEFPFLRSEPDSNRCKRFCRPLPSRSAIRPYEGAKIGDFDLESNKNYLEIISPSAIWMTLSVLDAKSSSWVTINN